MRKNFIKIKIGQKFLNNFGNIVTIVSKDENQYVDENGLKYNDSGNCGQKGKNWNLQKRL